MIRKFFFISTIALLILALCAGIVSALETPPATVVKANLDNVRFYAPASQAAGMNYAVDGGELFVGRPGEWRKVATPEGVIVGALAVDRIHPSAIYFGAANDLAIYRMDAGHSSWMRVPLSNEYVGGVTSLAIDRANRLLYAGTDTAGIFRLRDVGSSLISGGHLELSEPVVEIAADSTGAGRVFARTHSTLYRADTQGMVWTAVENLGSTPTALAVTNGIPAMVYVGTADRGLLTSQDGLTWSMANDGLNFVPGSRLMIDAIAADPTHSDVLYVATSYLYGTTTVHQSPVGVSMTTNGGATWRMLADGTKVPVAELLPVTGQTGAVYALTLDSRQPQALGSAAVIDEYGSVAASSPSTGVAWTRIAAWIIAAFAGLALIFALISDLRRPTENTPAPSLQRQMVGH